VIGFRSSCDASATNRRSESRARSRRGEHAVQRLGEPVDLVGAAAFAHRQAQRRVARPLDHGGAGREPLERPQRPAGENQRQRGRQRRRQKGAADDEAPGLVERVLDVVRRRGHDDGAAGRRAAHIGQRRHVHPDLRAAQVRIGVAPTPARDRRRDQRAHRDRPALEAEGSRDDPAPAVVNFDVDEARAG
jgi:hypothetical protein